MRVKERSDHRGGLEPDALLAGFVPGLAAQPVEGNGCAVDETDERRGPRGRIGAVRLDAAGPLRADRIDCRPYSAAARRRCQTATPVGST